MSDLNLKTVPLAAVVYVVRFDETGRPLKEAGIHIEVSGATHVEGCAAASLEPLLAATRGCMKATVGRSMLEVFEEREALELMGGLEATGAEEEAWDPLPAAGDCF